MKDFEVGDVIEYRNDKCIIIEVGKTYICIKNTYTGQTYMLPTVKYKVVNSKVLKE